MTGVEQTALDTGNEYIVNHHTVRRKKNMDYAVKLDTINLSVWKLTVQHIQFHYYI